jgi:hypothetical protein
MNFRNLRTWSVMVCLAVLWLPGPASAQRVGRLDCRMGPVAKLYGGSNWMVYSCDDNLTVVIVAVPGTPAAPFQFMFVPDGGFYQLRGEGTGKRSATEPVYNQLRLFTGPDIAALIAETRKRGVTNPGR